MSGRIIDIEDAVVALGHRIVLRHVNLHISRGEFVGVLGPNGAGKTTLLRLINGLLRAVSGRVVVLGVSLPNRHGPRLRRRIGYVAQVEHIDPRLPMTVRQTVMTGAFGRIGWFQRPTAEDWRIVDRTLDLVGVAHLAHRPIGHLSGGEYQRTAIARVLVQEPDLFLFDEPTASIDPRAQRDILGLIQEIHRREGITALYVTHDVRFLAETCQRLVLMKDGRIWRDGPRDELLETGLLRELYDAEASSTDPAVTASGSESCCVSP